MLTALVAFLITVGVYLADTIQIFVDFFLQFLHLHFLCLLALTGLYKLSTFLLGRRLTVLGSLYC